MITLTGTTKGIQVEIHGEHFVVKDNLTISEMSIGLSAKMSDFDDTNVYDPPLIDYRNDETIFNDPDMVK